MRTSKIMNALAIIEIMGISTILIIILAYSTSNLRYDVNHDGTVDVSDAVTILNYIKEGE